MSENMIFVSKGVSKEDKRIFVESYLFELIRLKEDLNIKYWHKLSCYYELCKKSKYKITTYIYDKYKNSFDNIDEFMGIISSLINNQYLFQKRHGGRKISN